MGNRAFKAKQKSQTHHRLRPQRKDDSLPPRPVQPAQNVRLRHILDRHLVVVVRVVTEDDAVNLVGGAAEPALLDVVEDRLEPGLRTRYVGDLAHADAEAAPQKAAEVRGRVGELVRLVAAALEGDEDA
jgi:hypothetical protein